MGKRKTSTGNNNDLPFTLEFRVLFCLLLFALALEFSLLFYHEVDDIGTAPSTQNRFDAMELSPQQAIPVESNKGNPHLDPLPPYLPPFAPIPNDDALISDVLAGKPTVTGIMALLNRFLDELHAVNIAFKNKKPLVTEKEVVDAFLDLAKKHLVEFDAVYRGGPIFDVREDDSIFMSLAAYREHLLAATLRQAFSHAANPDRIFIGAVVQNCFGIESTCRTGVQVVGKDSNGRPITKVSDAPPDVNGIDEFCNDQDYSKYCESGQVRALYVNETESVGPAAARYLASKLWGGETYFVQSDSHLEFAQNWDALYTKEVQLAKNYPKAILSAYPPGFGGTKGEDTHGAKLCACEFSKTDVEHHIIRINSAGNYDKIPPNPKQTPFMAAGFFFARAEFLVDVPFDPLLPWCFMGEEIALSMRSWTSGWRIYAPRHNLIAHQYRPGRMGLPKFWETVGRTYNRPGPGFNTKLQKIVIKRIKHLVGYPSASKEQVDSEGDGAVLDDIEYYGLGNEETYTAYLEYAGIDVEKESCKLQQWCMQGLYD